MPGVKKLFVLSAVLVCSAIAWAQSGPVTAMGGTNGSDVTGSAVVMVKNSNFDVGYGADFSATKYLTRHWGFRAEADWTAMNDYSYREYGARGGAVYKFKLSPNTQPYFEYLVGYAKTRVTFFKGPLVYHDGLSMLGGGGLDYRVRNGLFVRAGVDMVADNSDKGFGNKYGRVTLGIAYHIGDRQ
ncbi:MAG TPA: outer membrane beta-barrel protein [Candidatus Acidoferrales bacterium]|nr:outer membrane beta-barrel protein [Candidatus Acidoferrales bacterium]